MFDFLRSIDGFSRPVEDLRVKTTTGGLGALRAMSLVCAHSPHPRYSLLLCTVSVTAIVLMISLFFSELSFFLTPVSCTRTS